LETIFNWKDSISFMGFRRHGKRSGHGRHKNFGRRVPGSRVEMLMQRDLITAALAKAEANLARDPKNPDLQKQAAILREQHAALKRQFYS
jgi:hypothetical protein